MKHYLFFLFAFIALTMLSCSSAQNRPANHLQQWMTPNGKMKVLTTISMIGDLVQQVGGEYVDNMTLICGELDPHSYQLVKGDDEKLAYAELIFYNGLNLEHGPSLQRHLKSNSKAIALGDQIQKQDPSLILRYQGRSDPHIWMDISLWIKTVPFIVQALSEKDPSHADAYHRNGEALISLMQLAHENILKEMHTIPENHRYLVTSHDAFNYFARAYLANAEERANQDWQKHVAAPEGLSPESQLSALDITMIINYLQEHDVHVLFPESNVSKDSIKKIVSAGKEKGLSLTIADVRLYADAMGSPGSEGDTYLKMIKFDAEAIANYLKKNGNS